MCICKYLLNYFKKNIEINLRNLYEHRINGKKLY